MAKIELFPDSGLWVEGLSEEFAQRALTEGFDPHTLLAIVTWPDKIRSLLNAPNSTFEQLYDLMQEQITQNPALTQCRQEAKNLNFAAAYKTK